MDLFTIKRIEKILELYINAKVPQHVRSSVRLTYNWENNSLSLSEERPVLHERVWKCHDIARFSLHEGLWHVYANNSYGKWYAVSAIVPHPDFEQQLEQVEIDHENVFWIAEEEHEIPFIPMNRQRLEGDLE